MSCRAKSFHVHSNLHRESLIPQLTRSWLAEYLVECRVFDKIERTESREIKDRKEVPESRSRHNSATIGQEGGLQDVVSGTMCCAERVTGTRRFLFRSQAWFLLPVPVTDNLFPFTANPRERHSARGRVVGVAVALAVAACGPYWQLH